MYEERTGIVLAVIVILIDYVCIISGIQCPAPSHSLYSQVVAQDNPTPGSTARYSCDEGYVLFGTHIRVCTQSGKWSGEEPFCAVNVAYGKPANQSSTVRGGDASLANDEQAYKGKNRCSETNVENSPWWKLDLLHPYEVKAVQITSRKCCAQYHLSDMEIRVGNSTSIQGNKLCTWHHEIRNNMTNAFHCVYPIIGRYVSVQLIGVYGILSLCNVQVFTTKELAVSRCSEEGLSNFTVFNHTCYEFITHLGESFQGARDYCSNNSGDILHHVNNRTHSFIAGELEKRKGGLKSLFLWVGAKLDTRYKPPVWYWVTRKKVTNFLWAVNQPNNYNGQQNCIALDGNNKWLWNDVACELDNLPWICQYNSLYCGSPDRKENSVYFPIQGRYVSGQTVTYTCTVGSLLEGNATRLCGMDGFWKGDPPICKYIDCGELPQIGNGRLVYDDQRTSLGAKAHYVCNTNYTLSSHGVLTCTDRGNWNGNVPRCFLTVCQRPDVPRYAVVVNPSREIYSKATYHCQSGYRLIGQNVRTCQANGKWSGKAPFCKYVRCGRMPSISNGQITYENGTTHFESVVKYSCNPGYILIGNDTRKCTGNSQWTGTTPKCEVVDCGVPEELANGRFKLETRTTYYGSVVKYECLSKYQVRGTNERRCLENGSWSGVQPYCEVIDCGEPVNIPHGTAHLLNRSTVFNSMVRYKCFLDYRLVGPPYRTCLSTGKWSRPRPRCVPYENEKKNFTTTTEIPNVVIETDTINNVIESESDYSERESEPSILLTGVGVAVGTLCLLLIIFVALVVHLRMKRKVQELKGAKEVEGVIRTVDASITSYSQIGSNPDIRKGSRKEELPSTSGVNLVSFDKRLHSTNNGTRTDVSDSYSNSKRHS